MALGRMALLMAVVALAGAGQASASDPFYTYSGATPLAQHPNGAVLKVRTVQAHLDDLPLPMDVHQILYRSTGMGGKPTANVTSILKPGFTPVSQKVVAYGSFYDSLDPADSPSRALAGQSNPELGGVIANLETILVQGFVSQGYTVVITDTEGRARAGVYMVRFLLPGNAIYATNDAADDSMDSDINDDGANAGFSDPVAMPPGVTVVDAGVRSNTAGITIGNQVWRDNDVDGIQEGVNQQGPGDEHGHGNAIVELWNDSLTQRLAVTGSSTIPPIGTYSLPAKAFGAYRVKAALNAGEACTKPNTTSDTFDSDLFQDPPLTCVSDTIRPPTTTTSLDIGTTYQSYVGNWTWIDTDGDGIQDVGEQGLPGVRMEMWNIARTIMYESTVSNQYGSYSLHTPYPGSFRMRAILPAGYKHSPELAVPDTTIDSDINNDGPDAGWTDAFTMQAFVSSSRYDAGFVPTP